ncbi:MAG: FecR domain-containing protein [Hyphomicrobiaceae bacterium]|nr:FecR domain-containing protein [Hyphomicrobiaceae bacterium]
MEDSSRGDAAEGAAEDEARRWLLLALSDEFSERDAERLIAWRRRSRQNEEAWQEAASTWRDAGDMREAFAPLAANTHQARFQPVKRLRLRPALAGLAAAAIAFIAVLLTDDIRIYFLADHQTWHGQMNKVVLPDRSTVHLNTGSAIALEFSPAQRKVRLLEGEAVFDVQEDTARPFTVVTDNFSATALGTKFVVRTTGATNAVTVAEGRVQIAAVDDDKAGKTPPRSVVLLAAQHAELRQGHGPGPVTAVAPETVAPWRWGVILIEKLPFTQAVAELDRYLPGKILVAADTSELTPVTARFSTQDIRGALDALAATHGLNVNRLSRYLTILY